MRATPPKTGTSYPVCMYDSSVSSVVKSCRDNLNLVQNIQLHYESFYTRNVFSGCFAVSTVLFSSLEAFDTWIVL